MRERTLNSSLLFLMAALFAAIALVGPVHTAFAQDAMAPVGAPAAGDKSILDLILDGVALALPSIVIAGFAWLKAHAAQTEAKWDDWTVARVEQIAQGIVDKNAAK